MSLSDFDKRVCNAHLSYITHANLEDQSYEFVGVEMYLQLRQICGKLFKKKMDLIVPTFKNKKDKIQWENSIRLSREMFSEKKNIFKNPMSLLKSSIIEYKSIGFFILAKIEMEREERNIESLFSIIIALQKILTYLEKMGGYQYLKNDIGIYISELIKYSDYSTYELQKNASHLITKSLFDEYVPQEPLEPYPHQKDLYNIFSDTEFLKNGGLCFVSTATNSGKTFAVLGMAKKIDILSKYVYKPLIFTCSVSSVRDKVEELLTYAKIPYHVILEQKCTFPGCQNYSSCEAHGVKDAYYTMDPNLREELIFNSQTRQKLKHEGFQKNSKRKTYSVVDGNIITNPLSYSTPKKPFVFIGSPKVVTDFLNDQGSDCFLFFDEFTIASDKIGDELSMHMNLIKNAPKWTFLSSANFKVDEKVNKLLIHFKGRYPDSIIREISSQTIYTNSIVTSFSGKRITPHSDCANLVSFCKKLDNISKNQFKGRMYDMSILKNMCELAEKIIRWNFTYEDDDADEDSIAKYIGMLPDIDCILSNISNCYPDNVRRLCMEILNVVKNIDDDEVIPPFTKIIKSAPISLDFLKASSENQNMILIGTQYPKSFAVSTFKEMAEIRVSKLIDDYNTKLEQWINAKEKMMNRFSSEEAFQKHIRESGIDFDDEKPTFHIPEEYQLGSRKFCKVHSIKYNYRAPISLNDIDYENIRDESLIALLLCGVGVYDKDEKDINYLNNLFKLGISNKLVYIVSNVSHGIDYQFSNVYIMDDYFRMNTMNNVYQLLSRGGRGCTGNIANIFVSDNCADSILNECEDDDVMNMMSYF